ncbi:Methyltransferase-like protein 7B [Coccomyxa sp. Obi]|nr:Methyltransferase-like protein 7B [Coccomyxa sp. Obi]
MTHPTLPTFHCTGALLLFPPIISKGGLRKQAIRIDSHIRARDARASRVSCQSTRRALLGLSCSCGLCQCKRRMQWYDKYFAWNMSQFEEEYEELVGPTKKELFSQFIPADAGSLSILDVGAGTLPNAKYFQDMAVTAVDPNQEMWPYARASAARHGVRSLTLVNGVAESLPFADGSFDRAVCTLVLCSVTDVEAAVRELHRVLKPGGKLLFLEHVAAGQERPLLRLSQTLLNPLQRALADGCNLIRDPLESIRSERFEMEEERHFFIPSLGLIGPHVSGIAVR